MDGESDEWNRSRALFLFRDVLLQSDGRSPGSCCVSDNTLAFNLTKSFSMRRGGPPLAATLYPLRVLIRDKHGRDTSPEMGKFRRACDDVDEGLMDVRLRRVAHVVSSFPWRFVWQLCYYLRE